MSRGRGGGERGSARGRSRKLPPGVSFNEIKHMRMKAEPSQLYPPIDVPIQRNPTQSEMLQVRFFKEIRTGITEDSPFYITTKEDRLDPEDDGIERYSDRFKDPKRRNRLSLLDIHADPSLFPDELHPAIISGTARTVKRPKKLDVQDFLNMALPNDTGEKTEEGPAPEGPDGPNQENPERDDEQTSDLDEEDDFGDDEDNDYGENYFDNGDDDDFDDAGGDEGYI